MFIHTVKRALDENRSFRLNTTAKTCSNLNMLLDYLPTVLTQVDDVLFDGALQTFLRQKKIPLLIKRSNIGPAGITTCDALKGMCICLNTFAWLEKSSTGMVGGVLCQSADVCLTQTFLHELIHVILFCIYIELEISQKETEALIPTYFDSTHHIIFTKWLKQFFNQDTIDNSLLLHMNPQTTPLRFEKSVIDIEHTCLVKNNSKPLRVLYQGTWQTATKTKNQTNIQPHHTRVQTLAGQRLIVPNGLLAC